MNVAPLVAALAMLLASSTRAQHDDAMFAAGQVTVDGRSYPYRLLTPPPGHDGQPMPLVVFLHGAGERGDDNEHQLHWLPRVLAGAANRRSYPCYLLALQCPEDQRWVEVPWGAAQSTPLPASPSQPTRAVLAALHAARHDHPIDPARVYLTGLSMGGYGAFDLAARHPELFAAVVPVCGGGDERQADRIAALPAWIWHGDQDAAVPVERSRTMHQALLQAGGDVRYTELPGIGHDSWRQAYGDDGALQWMFAQRRAPAPLADLVPYPAAAAKLPGGFRIPATLHLGTDGAAAPAAAVLADDLHRLTGAEVVLARDAASLRLAVEASLGSGAYRLQVTADGVVIVGGDTHGLAAGSAALLQALRADDAGWAAPCGTLADRPAFAFRAVMIDCARHFQSLDELRRVIDLCRFYRVPLLQLHLSDHEGFRFPSQAFPEVVSDQHYTLDELRQLDAYAAARGVTIVPELDVPGHSKALVTGRPEVFALADERNQGVINLGRAAARQGVATLIAELCAVFARSPYVHIGGDEVDLTGVADDPDCRACMAANDLADVHELMRWFVVQMHDAVSALGKQTLVWEGFSPGGKPAMPKDLIVIAWESAYYPPDRLIEDGFTVVNASWRPLYVVGGGKLPPHAAPRRWSAREIHAWHPRRWEHFAPQYPSFRGIEVATDAPVLGAMMCVWEQLDDTAFAHLRSRLPAFAERTCRPDDGRDYRDFAARAHAADLRLQAVLGPPPAPAADEWQRFVDSGAPRVRYRWFRAPAAGLPELPDFTTLQPFASGTQPILRGGAVAGPLGVELRATLDVPVTGDYVLRLESCDGPARLFLDGDLAVAHDRRGHWEGQEATVHLEQGAIALRVEYAQAFFSTLCRVQWRRPGRHTFELIDPALRELRQ